MKNRTNCDDCMFYTYQEEYAYYVCEKDLDQDEMFHFLEGTLNNCCYYQSGNEYKIVEKQN